MDKIVTDALQRLIAAQRVDGGWNWWKDSPFPSDPVLSAIALEALRSAKETGFTVDNQVTTKGINYLTQQLNDENLSLSDKSFLARTIALYQPVSSGTLSILMNHRWEMNAQSRADLLTAMDLSNSTISDRNRLYNELLSLMKKTNTTAHFAERNRNNTRYYYNDSYDANPNQLTASMMEAITRRDSRNPLLSELLRYFDTSKQQGYWRSTRETALVTHAIANLIDRRQDLKGSFNWQIVLNQTKSAEGTFNPKSGSRQNNGTIPLTQLQVGDNKLGFMKSGDGNLYYNLNYSYYIPFSEVPAREQGMVLLREIVDSQGNLIKPEAIQQGEEYWIRLTLAAPQRVTNVIIEDKLPAGFEAVNESLATTAMNNVDKPKVNQNKDESLDTPDYQNEMTSSLYVSHQEMRDDRVVLFANTINPGVYEYTYRVHANIPGKFHYPPASASNMYVPEINGHSHGGWLTIKDSQ